MKAHSEPRAVLWDLDGTLVDTAPVHWVVWREILMGEGRAGLTWEEFVPSFGLRNDQTLRYWFPAISTADIERIDVVKEARFREVILEQPPPLLPGAGEWLATLHAKGWRQALATMAPCANVEAILCALDLQSAFDAVVTAEDVQRGKPDPQVFLLAAARLGLAPERCIVVEDSPAGVEAAYRAAMSCVGVKSRGQELKADLVVPGLDQLPADAFEKLLRQPARQSK